MVGSRSYAILLRCSRFTDPDVWTRLLVLAASGATIWKAACVSEHHASNDRESTVDLIWLVHLLLTLQLQAILIWVPYTNTNGQWIASKLLQGFFGAPLESLCEISLTDIACRPSKKKPAEEIPFS